MCTCGVMRSDADEMLKGRGEERKRTLIVENDRQPSAKRGQDVCREESPLPSLLDKRRRERLMFCSCKLQLSLRRHRWPSQEKI